MSQKIELKLNKKVFSNLLKSLLFTLLIFFIIEHFGQFTKEYITDYYITFKTPFGNELTSCQDLLGNNKGDKFGESYFDKLPYYMIAILHDFAYYLVSSLIIWGILIFRQFVNIKLN